MIKILAGWLIFYSLPFLSMAQDHIGYPDSLRTVVLKIDPAAVLFGHLSAGAEIPLRKLFLDLSTGFGFSKAYNRRGGFISKVGVKIPLKSNNPLHLLYMMPEIALSDYKTTSSDPNQGYYSTELTKVTAMAIMAGFGYRHLNPYSRFYYDASIDVGYGWTNHWDAYNNYNFIILNQNDVYLPDNTTSGMAVSCHFAIGILLKSNTKQ